MITTGLLCIIVAQGLTIGYMIPAYRLRHANARRWWMVTEILKRQHAIMIKTNGNEITTGRGSCTGATIDISLAIALGEASDDER